MTIDVDQIKDKIRLCVRHPDPAGGRADVEVIDTLSVEQANRLIKQINDAIPEALKVELQNRQAALSVAEDELIRAEVKVQSIKDHIKKLKGR